MSYWKLRNEENVIFNTFEEMKRVSLYSSIENVFNHYLGYIDTTKNFGFRIEEILKYRMEFIKR